MIVILFSIEGKLFECIENLFISFIMQRLNSFTCYKVNSLTPTRKRASLETRLRCRLRSWNTSEKISARLLGAELFEEVVGGRSC